MSKYADNYLAQVRLLLDVLPIVAQRKDFALKGGTAINFFFRDGPRLSVDIDLHYLPNHDRDKALAGITENLEAIKSRIEAALPGSNVRIEPNRNAVIQYRRTLVKLEPNTVIRGQLLPPVQRALCPSIAARFASAVTLNCVDRSELFAGKLCAALQRQHPRDLFDVMLMLQEDGGMTEAIKDAFLIYVISQGKPMSETLFPRPKPLEAEYRNHFVGMINSDIPLAALQQVQRNLPALLWATLTDTDKQFLLNFKKLQPDWTLIRHQHASELPAVAWKQLNLGQLRDSNPKKYRAAIRQLEQRLASGPRPDEGP